MTVPSGYRVTEFRAEGVWVAAPENLVVTLRPIIGLVEGMATQDDFQPLRIIGNLKFQNPIEPDQTVFVFDPPARLQVRFTGKDNERASGRKRALAFAWWNSTEWMWLLPTDAPLIFEEEVSSGGYRAYELGDISDPPI
jgi:hypothetical protein